MGKRPRTNMSGLVSHTLPDGKSYSSPRNKAEQSLNKLKKMTESGDWKVIKAVKKSDGEPFKMFGTITIEIPVEILIKAGFRK